MTQDQWTQQLHDKLAQHEVAAPDDLWADIEAALQQQGTRGDGRQEGESQGYQRARRSRFVALRRWAVAASLSAVVIGGSLLWWSQGSHRAAEAPQDLIASAESPQDDDAAVEGPNGDDAAVESPHGGDGAVGGPHGLVSAPDGSAHSYATTSTAPASKEPVGATMVAAAPDGSTADGSTAGPESLGGKTAEHSSNEAASAPNHIANLKSQTSNLKPQISNLKSQTSNLKPTVGLFAMNGFGSQDNRNGIYMAPSLVRQYTDTYANSNIAGARGGYIFQLSGYEEREHHYLPVTYGLTVSYPLTDRLSLTSGVVYTKLRSDFTQVMPSMQVQQEQTLHYVGIPLTLSYSLWKVSPSFLSLPSTLQTYISAGVKADWNVATHLETEGVSQELSKDRMQWSLMGSIGIQYDIIPQLGLYVEPGLNWYPDNGSHLQNYFKDKPLSFSLQLGLRVKMKTEE